MDFIAGLFISVYQDDRPLRVQRRGSLEDSPEAAIVLGEAPDGLPLVLQVERRASIEYGVMSALGHPPRESLPQDLLAALNALEEAVRKRARQTGLTTIEGRRAYVTSATVGSLFGETLLARLLGAQSPLILAEDRYSASSQPEMVAITSAVAMSAAPVEVMTEILTKGYLAVPLVEGQPWIVEPPKASGDETNFGSGPAQRKLILESLASLPSARFHWQVDQRQGEGPLADERGYERAVRDSSFLCWSVARQDIGRAVLQLAACLQALHAAGRVHCDVKPGNILLGEAGAVSIDAVPVSAGQISPAATPGWAAPEQILARPATPATDVYALGLLLTSLVEGAIYGEERSYVIPTGKSERRRLRVLASPEVFIDPTHLPFSDAARRDWQHLIARCVAFEPESRPADAAAFAQQLDELLARHPLPGRRGLRSGPGRLTRNVEILGRLQPSWVLTDRR